MGKRSHLLAFRLGRQEKSSHQHIFYGFSPASHGVGCLFSIKILRSGIPYGSSDSE